MNDIADRQEGVCRMPRQASGDPGTYTLDARGLMCPEPVRLAESGMRALPAGSVLVIQATDAAAPLDLEAWCIRRGHEWLGHDQLGDTTLEIRIRKAA